MRIINQTSYPTFELHRFILLANPDPRHAQYLVITFAYGEGKFVSGTTQYGRNITVRLPHPAEHEAAGVEHPLRYQGNKAKGYVGLEVKSLASEIVYVLSHEFRHVQQWKQSEKPQHFVVEGAKRERYVPRSYQTQDAANKGIAKMERDADLHAIYHMSSLQAASRPSGWAQSIFGEHFGKKKKKYTIERGGWRGGVF
jgi:hypothetical protein